MQRIIPMHVGRTYYHIYDFMILEIHMPRSSAIILKMVLV